MAIGNLTPVGQNSGQVGCRWPPNGHHLAGCLGLPQRAQLWGAFLVQRHHPLCAGAPNGLCPARIPTQPSPVGRRRPPQDIFRLQWREGYWQPLPQHQGQDIELLGDRYLMPINSLRDFWPRYQSTTAQLVHLPWQTLTLSHNRRKDFQVVEEGGFFAEMTTLMNPGWSLAVRLMGDFYPTPAGAPWGPGARRWSSTPCGSRGIGWATPAPMPPEPFC